MEGKPLNDYLSLLPSTLQWISTQLGSVSRIPRPLWIGGLFPIYIAVISFVLWFLRGRIWPLACAYPRTSKRRPCRMVVAGEWARCRHHNRPRTYAYRHEVQKIYRWQTLTKNDKIINRPQKGVGVLRLRPAGATLLYERGYVRPPMAVLKLAPTEVKAGVQRLRQARLTTQTDPPPVSQVAVSALRTDLAEGLERVVRATRFATAAFCVAVALTLVAVVLNGLSQTVLQYLATLGFVLAWAATSSGLAGRGSDRAG
jgi:hypothetical protein